MWLVINIESCLRVVIFERAVLAASELSTAVFADVHWYSLISILMVIVFLSVRAMAYLQVGRIRHVYLALGVVG